MKNIGMLLCLFLFSMQSFAVESEEKLVFYTQEFAPFSYSENGRVAGPGVEIIQKACDNINVKCVIEVLPWVRAQEEVKRGNADGMFFVGKHMCAFRQLFQRRFLPIAVAKCLVRY